MSCPNMVDSCMTKCRHYPRWGYGPSGHLPYPPACSRRGYLSHDWFSPPMVVVETPNAISQSEACLLRTLPSPEHFPPHLHKTPHQCLVNWSEGGRESCEGGTRMDPFLPGSVQDTLSCPSAPPAPTGKQVPKDSITSRTAILFTKCHPNGSSVFIP